MASFFFFRILVCALPSICSHVWAVMHELIDRGDTHTLVDLACFVNTLFS